MSTAPSASSVVDAIAPLEPGDRMGAAEFYRRDAVTPDRFRTELIEGVVNMAAAVQVQHGRCRGPIAGLLNEYCSETPGTDTVADDTARLDDSNQPQPDVSAFIDSSCGVRTRIDSDGYLSGGPAMLVEISHSTEPRSCKRCVRASHRRNIDPSSMGSQRSAVADSLSSDFRR